MSWNVPLIEARRNAGLSVHAAARKIGIGRNVLLNAESGRNVPQPRHAKLIADFYGFRVTDLWPVVDPEGLAT